MSSGLRLFAIAAVAGCFPVAAANAQSMSPMSQEVVSFSDQFLARVTLRNPYSTAKDYVITSEAVEGDIEDLWFNPKSFVLAAGETREIILSAPFGVDVEKEFLLCAETLAAQSANQNLRGQVCARVKAQQHAYARAR